MRILFIGDVFGKPGRQSVDAWLPGFRRQMMVDWVIANGENAANGKGLTRATAHELFAAGIDVLTGGNHTFQHREIYPALDEDRRLLRPANLPPGVPGRGAAVFDVGEPPRRAAVLNLQGRAFMKPVDCPFRAADALVAELRQSTPIVIVDFHAEATSEKTAMAAYLDGRVSAVIGTHTHIPTADARVSPAGTVAITDVGMSGPFDSVIGIDTDIALQQMIVGLPIRHEVAKGPARVCALLMDVDEATGEATTVRQIITPAA